MRRPNPVLSGLKYIRDHYGVPAFLDYPVTWRGEAGVISGVSGPHVEVALTSGKKVGPIHPTDEDLEYGSRRAEDKLAEVGGLVTVVFLEAVMDELPTADRYRETVQGALQKLVGLLRDSLNREA